MTKRFTTVYQCQTCLYYSSRRNNTIRHIASKHQGYSSIVERTLFMVSGPVYQILPTSSPAIAHDTYLAPGSASGKTPFNPFEYVNKQIQPAIKLFENMNKLEKLSAPYFTQAPFVMLTPMPASMAAKTCIKPLRISFSVCKKCHQIIPILLKEKDGVFDLEEQGHTCTGKLDSITGSKSEEIFQGQQTEMLQTVYKLMVDFMHKDIVLSAHRIEDPSKFAKLLPLEYVEIDPTYHLSRAVRNTNCVISAEELRTFLESTSGATFAVYNVTVGSKTEFYFIEIEYVAAA